MCSLVKLYGSSKAVAGRQSTHDGDDRALAGAGGPRSLLDGGVSIVGQVQTNMVPQQLGDRNSRAIQAAMQKGGGGPLVR